MQRNSTIRILPLIAGILFASCAKESTDGYAGPDNGIRFGVGQADSWNSVPKGKAAEATANGVVSQNLLLQGGEDSLYLRAVTSDGIRTGMESDGAATRGVPVTTAAMHSSFGVSTYAYTGAWSESLKPDYMYNVKVQQTSPTVWASESDYYWPGQGYKVRFFAYAPHNAAGLTLPVRTTAGTPVLGYEVPDDVAEQNDLLVAKSGELAGDWNAAADLTFHHALTAVCFVAGNHTADKNIIKVSLQGVYGSGSFQMSSLSWSGLDDVKSFSQTLDVTLDGTQDAPITPTAGTFMMIPQTLPTGAEIEIELADHTLLTASIGDTEWPIGKTVTYRISLTPNYQIALTAPSSIGPDGGSTAFTLSGTFPDWNIRAVLASDGAVIGSPVAATPTTDGTSDVYLDIAANTGADRTVTIQYEHPTDGWTNLGNLTQYGYYIERIEPASYVSQPGGNTTITLRGYFPVWAIRAVNSGGTVVAPGVNTAATGNPLGYETYAVTLNFQANPSTTADRTLTIQYQNRLGEWIAVVNGNIVQRKTYEPGISTLTPGYGDVLYFADASNAFSTGTLAVGRWGETSALTQSALAFFQFGSVSGFKIESTNQSWTTANSGRFGFDPRPTNTSYTWGNIQNLGNSSGTKNISANSYHTLANVKAGKGDPCRLVGMTPNEIRGYTSNAQLYAREEALKEAGIGGWRTATAVENAMYVGGTLYQATDIEQNQSYAAGSYAYWSSNTAGFPVNNPTSLMKGGGLRDADGKSSSYLTMGNYWSSTAVSYNTTQGHYMYFYSDNAIPAQRNDFVRGYGVRCVKPE